MLPSGRPRATDAGQAHSWGELLIIQPVKRRLKRQQFSIPALPLTIVQRPHELQGVLVCPPGVRDGHVGAHAPALIARRAHENAAYVEVFPDQVFNRVIVEHERAHGRHSGMFRAIAIHNVASSNHQCEAAGGARQVAPLREIPHGAPRNTIVSIAAMLPGKLRRWPPSAHAKHCDAAVNSPMYVLGWSIADGIRDLAVLPFMVWRRSIQTVAAHSMPISIGGIRFLVALCRKAGISAAQSARPCAASGLNVTGSGADRPGTRTAAQVRTFVAQHFVSAHIGRHWKNGEPSLSDDVPHSLHLRRFRLELAYRPAPPPGPAYARAA